MALLIPNPDDDPRVRRQHAKRVDLLRRLAEAEAAHRALVDEQMAVTRQRHEATVSNMLGDGPAPAGGAERLEELRVAIAESTATLDALRDASHQQDVITRGIRKQVLGEIRDQVRGDVRVVVRRQAMLLAELEQLQRDVHAVAQSRLIEMDSSFSQILSLLPIWKRAAEKMCGGPLEPAVQSEPAVVEEVACPATVQ